MKTNVVIFMIALLASSFTVNTVYSQFEDFKQKKTPEERAQKFSEKLSKELSLSSDQQSSVYSIMLAHCTKADEIRAAETDKDSRKSQIKSLWESTDVQIQNVLNEEQVTKYNELKQKMREKKKQKKGKQKNN
jgi:hypothetical protein